MKVMSEWFESVIDTMEQKNQPSATYLLLLMVLIVAAGSLYMLVNAPA